MKMKELAAQGRFRAKLRPFDPAGLKKGGEKKVKTRVQTALMAMGLVLLCSAAFAALKDGVKLEAAGKAIDVEVGHAVPVVTDWNADGKKDLIVGQFGGGKIRLYLNQGTDSAPVFEKFTYLRAGGSEISLPSG